MCLACIALMCAGHRLLAARPLMEHNGRPAHCARAESRGVAILLEFPMKFTAGILRKQLAALPPVKFLIRRGNLEHLYDFFLLSSLWTYTSLDNLLSELFVVVQSMTGPIRVL